MNTTSVSLSLAGAAIAIAILWANLRPWLAGGRDPKALVPYGAGAALGSLATICVGGALGWGARGIAGAATAGGDKGVRKTAGTGQSALPTGRMGVLTPEGGVVVCLILVAVVLLFKAAGKKEKRRILGGFVSFAILGFLPGVAATLTWWPDTVNWAGAELAGALSTTGSFL
ncbi:hypothetical protein AB0F42_24390 [Streptomyces buecherae]|uniref:hypothetical protein n=1 Tax=Streptomyces buecherae TaxID=2763006 RepID=UPI0033FD9604